MHCGSIAGSPRNKELSFAECLRVADEILDLQCKDLTFIGGEVFLYPGWEKIANYLHKSGIRVNIMSNGFKIGAEEINQIKFAGLSNVGISLDGPEAIHNKIRNNRSSYSHIQNAFTLLNKADIPIGVVTSLLEMNYPFLEDLYQILIANKVNLWQIQLVNPMGNMRNKLDLILNQSRIPELIRFIRDKNQDRNMLIIAADNVGYYHDDSEGFIRGTSSPFCYWTGCSAGITSLFIDSVGNVKGCGALYDEHFIEGNLRMNSLHEIWNNEENFSYNRRFSIDKLTGNCKDCDVGSLCHGGCRASNYFMKDSLYENTFCSHFVSAKL